MALTKKIERLKRGTIIGADIQGEWGNDRLVLKYECTAPGRESLRVCLSESDKPEADWLVFDVHTHAARPALAQTGEG